MKNCTSPRCRNYTQQVNHDYCHICKRTSKNLEYLLNNYTVSDLKTMLKNTKTQIEKINKDLDSPLSTGRTPRQIGCPEMEKLILAHQEQADLIGFILKKRLL